NSRFAVEVSGDREEEFKELFTSVPIERIGVTVNSGMLKISDLIEAEIKEIKQIYTGALKW
uniref:hypothetical protein n=1 Tax=Nocardia farcinica TaxID=37329 RepID=UPI001E406087